jgi:hypothetical protein
LNEETVVLFMFHSIEYAKRMPRPRFIKTHLPISCLPKDILNKCKVKYHNKVTFRNDKLVKSKKLKFLA